MQAPLKRGISHHIQPSHIDKYRNTNFNEGVTFVDIHLAEEKNP